METILRPLIDTNILIDYLLGLEQAREELKRHKNPAISLISWMEVLAGVRSPDEEKTIRAFLEHFEVLPVNRQIAELALEKQRHYDLRFPSALIWATAEAHSMVLVTRNKQDFPSPVIGIHIPYELPEEPDFGDEDPFDEDDTVSTP